MLNGQRSMVNVQWSMSTPSPASSSAAAHPAPPPFRACPPVSISSMATKSSGTGGNFPSSPFERKSRQIVLRFADFYLPLQATTKKVVTKKVVIWRIPLQFSPTLIRRYPRPNFTFPPWEHQFPIGGTKGSHRGKVQSEACFTGLVLLPPYCHPATRYFLLHPPSATCSPVVAPFLQLAKQLQQILKPVSEKSNTFATLLL